MIVICFFYTRLYDRLMSIAKLTLFALAILLSKDLIIIFNINNTYYILLYIYNLIESGIIDLIYINILNKKADGVIKALEKVKFKLFL